MTVTRCMPDPHMKPTSLPIAPRGLPAYVQVFLLGFFAYCFFEIALRGRTHWTMGILGGISLAVLYSMEHRLTDPLPVRALLGACFVTAAEFTTGVFDNLIMGWQVWDYSDRPFNILGQVCPLFSGIWYVLCLAASFLIRLHGRRADQALV